VKLGQSPSTLDFVMHIVLRWGWIWEVPLIRMVEGIFLMILNRSYLLVVYFI
jgi:hypothetical protein